MRQPGLIDDPDRAAIGLKPDRAGGFSIDQHGEPSKASVLTCLVTRQKRRRGVVDTYKIYRESVDGLPQFGPEPDANPRNFWPGARRREDHASPRRTGGRARF